MQFLISYKELQGSVKLIVKNKGIIMIRKYKNSDLNFVSKIWLDTNVISHNFIAEEYWISNYDAVKEIRITRRMQPVTYKINYISVAIY